MDAKTRRPWYQIRWQVWLPSLMAVILTGAIYYIANRPAKITITTAPTGQNRTLKERMIFVFKLEKVFRKSGRMASVDLEGQDGKTLKIFWEELTPAMVRLLVESESLVTDVRDMGFKRMIFRNNRRVWDFDLKN